jgi:hypothetical protein
MTHRTLTLAAGLATALAALLLAGCGSEETAAPDSSADQSTVTSADQVVTDTSSNVAEDVPKKATAAEIAAREGDSPGKPVAPIDIEYEILGEPRPGEPVEIALKLASAVEGPVTVTLQPREGLQMGATQAAEIRRESIGRVAERAGESAGEPAGERVVVVPPAEGRFYLSVLVSVATPEGEQIRAVSIPVQVGDQPPAMRDNGELTTTEGETVRSLPAKESDGD